MCGKRWPMEGTTPIIVGISKIITKKCGVCGKEFKCYGSQDKACCSRRCAVSIRPHKEKECPVCHVKFYVRSKRANTFCSQKCYGLSRRTPDHEKQIYIPVPPKIKQCGVCGASFISKTAAKFCEVCREPARLKKIRETQKTDKYREAHRRAARAWQKNHAAKYHAATLAKSHPERLNIIYECPHPAQSKHHHHPDYLKPYDVLKLCEPCHRAEHARLRSLSAQAVAITG